MVMTPEQEARAILGEIGVFGAEGFDDKDLKPLTNRISAYRTLLNAVTCGIREHIDPIHSPHLTKHDVRSIVREMLGANKGILLGDSESEGDSNADGP